MKRLREIRLQRCVFDLHFPSKFRIELHGFSDSSLELYCAVVYFRFVSDCGVKVSLLASTVGNIHCWEYTLLVGFIGGIMLDSGQGIGLKGLGGESCCVDRERCWS